MAVTTNDDGISVESEHFCDFSSSITARQHLQESMV